MQAKQHKKNSAGDLKSLDMIYAVLLHILVFTVIAVLAFWQQQHKTEPLKRIEVMMITAKDLAKLEQQAKRKPKAIKQKKVEPKKVKPKPKPADKPKVITAPKPKPKPKPKVVKPPKPKPPLAKPVVKPKPAPKPEPVAKPKPIKKQVTKPAAKVDDDFDPFAPMQSSTDVKVSKKASTSKPAMADLVGKQLTKNEMERYVGLMQAAVQKEWKVALSATKFKDPLVEMKLFPNGDVASVKILESSGNDALDASLIRAIKAAAPFELPRQQFEFFRVNRIRFHPLK